MKFEEGTTKGLHLPKDVLRKLYHDNAVKWIPGHRVKDAPPEPGSVSGWSGRCWSSAFSSSTCRPHCGRVTPGSFISRSPPSSGSAWPWLSSASRSSRRSCGGCRPARRRMVASLAAALGIVVVGCTASCWLAACRRSTAMRPSTSAADPALGTAPRRDRRAGAGRGRASLGSRRNQRSSHSSTSGWWPSLVPAVATAQRANWKSSAQDAAALFGFSPRTNVLVVLLDGLQSNIAADLLEQRPALRAAFVGFSFYPDTLGAAPTTFLGLPAIHSGEVYTGRTTLARVLHASDCHAVVRDPIRRGRLHGRAGESARGYLSGRRDHGVHGCGGDPRHRVRAAMA